MLVPLLSYESPLQSVADVHCSVINISIFENVQKLKAIFFFQGEKNVDRISVLFAELTEKFGKVVLGIVF